MAIDLFALENAGAVNHAEDLRRLFYGIARGEGVLGATDLDVTQRGAGANMSVDVAAGRALVSDDQALPGLYPFLSTTTTNLTVAAADPTNPRVDIVVARVKDTQYGDGANTKTLEVITGTPAASPATPATPSRCLRLATLLIAASSSSVTNANIGDTRTWAPFAGDARGELANAQVTASQSLITSEVDASGLTATVTVEAGRRVRITATAVLSSSVSADIAAIRIKEGATQLQQASVACPAGGSGVTVTATAEVAPSSGSHTYKVTALRVSGTGNVTLSATATQPALIVVEDLGGASSL